MPRHDGTALAADSPASPAGVRTVVGARGEGAMSLGVHRRRCGAALGGTVAATWKESGLSSWITVSEPPTVRRKGEVGSGIEGAAVYTLADRQSRDEAAVRCVGRSP